MSAHRNKCLNLDYFVSVDFLRLKDEKFPVLLTVVSIKQPEIVHVASVDISDKLEMFYYLKRKYFIKQYMREREVTVTIKPEKVESYLKSFQISNEEIGLATWFATDGKEQKDFFDNYLEEVTNIEFVFDKVFTVFDCRSCFTKYKVDRIIDLRKTV
ncbi:hypothetical protein AVEN_75602-1 [Araneus ventricosus]|uniref:Uncharacterized protein n=1 Tax=Araneus ventricosus TaxID=182803 RepID=A0A4Y2CKG2_ARAVE|nr:hypothetical protein AVEN_75602-1 [Araneus ventricosus]